MMNSPLVPHQHKIDLFPVKEAEVNGILMGVLSDGTPYLSLRSLARLCGIDHTTLLPLTTNWDIERTKPRGRKIDNILKEQGFYYDSLYTTASGPGGVSHAYSDSVCMAILEYYAFDASQTDNDIAKNNYRTMSRRTLRDFIYRSVGIDPQNPLTSAWKCFQERVMLNDQLPPGFFSVFREMVDISVPLINAGYEFNPKNVIDISVGSRWANYWKKHELANKYGMQKKHPHNYPDWFPQRKAGPIDANVYPEEALGEFRKWMREDYIQNSLPDYLSDKVQDQAIDQKQAIALIEQLQKQKSLKK